MNPEANTTLNIMPASDLQEDVSIQGILPIQFQMVGQALRREIQALERTRDNDLRTKIPHKSAPWTFALETQSRCRDKSAALLQRARSQLHKAIDDLLDELDAETSAVHHVPRQQTTPITPVSGTRLHEPAPAPGSERLSQPRAPVAEMDGDIFGGQGNRARSVTMPIHEPAPVASDLPTAGPSTSGGERPGAVHTPPPPTTPQSKRPGADPAATTPSKRAKTSTATSSKAATASKIVTLQTPTKTTPGKGKKADSARKPASRIAATVDLDADEDYRQSQSQSDDDLPPIEDISRRLAHRAAKGKNVVYMDKPLGENEFVV